jgi:hypothetical protein
MASIHRNTSSYQSQPRIAMEGTMMIIDFRPRQLAARNAENIKRVRILVQGDNVVNDFVELLVSKSTKWSPEQQARGWELFTGQ